jgi:hypothetical protein
LWLIEIKHTIFYWWLSKANKTSGKIEKFHYTAKYLFTYYLVLRT